ncbi:hypothetical protein TWF694_008224 [Orbilia ellipsospora]|uniref:C2H2-type domain-containing protein n=1 Tax=Orbilia ellipsospora TaxID=2528407 RepID=A0AAV9XGT9_9PEZI
MPFIFQNSCEKCKTLKLPEGQHHCCYCRCYLFEPAFTKHNNKCHGGKPPDPTSPPFTCLDCAKDFFIEKFFNNHLTEHAKKRQKAEAARAKVQAVAQNKNASNPQRSTSPCRIFICPDCKKDFPTKGRRRKHICTARHRCINPKCLKTFKMLASMVDHLESGACKSGYDRNTINKIICERDTKGLITVPGARKELEDYLARYSIKAQEEEEWDIVSESSSGGVLLTPGSEFSFEEVTDALDGIQLDRDSNFDVQSIATLESDSAIATPATPVLISDPKKIVYACSICQKLFRKENDLRQHVVSPAHSPILYHCGLTFLDLELKGKVEKFKNLSGLVAHIEKGGCRGGQNTFDFGISMLGKLAEEFGFVGMEDLALHIGGSFMRSSQPPLVTNV